MAQRKTAGTLRGVQHGQDLVKSLVRKPVKEAVHEALSEQSAGDSTGESTAGSSRIGRPTLFLTLLGLATAALYWRRRNADRALGTELSETPGTGPTTPQAPTEQEQTVSTGPAGGRDEADQEQEPAEEASDEGAGTS